MPLYEYTCSKCKKNFEFLQGINDKPKSKCPDCSGKLVKRISSSNFQLKGKGWYATDYKDKPAACGKTENCSTCCAGA
ncbi:MAG: zinc ribbon domain-containing protein [Oligoflexia bacterium]|nr:zinc ribbon domain-containing protein [Oligoflexia bacterium]